MVPAKDTASPSRSRSKPTRRRLDPTERADEILDGAARLIHQDNAHALTMEAVAEESGASRALVYNYFGTLSGLLLELLKRESGRFEFMALAQIESDMPVSRWVEQAATLYLDAAQDMGPLFLALFQDRSVDADLESARAARHKLMIQMTSHRLAEGTGAPRSEAKAAAALLLGALHGGAEAIVRGGVERDAVEATYRSLSRNVVARLKRVAL